MGDQTGLNQIHKNNCDDILLILRSQGVDAICAGGFVRDFTFNKTVKDLDIYVNFKDLPNLDLSKLDPKYVTKFDGVDKIRENATEPKEYYSDSFSEIQKIYTGTYYGKNRYFSKFDIVVVDTPDIRDFVMNNFDFSFCRAYYDGTSFTKSQSFLDTERSKIVTISNDLSDYQKKHSIDNHLRRIYNKYKYDFKFDFSNHNMNLKKYLGHSKIVHSSNLSKLIHGSDYYIKDSQYMVIGGL